QGCNIDLHTRDNLVQRLKPRENLDVNGWWMCDYGRMDYEWMNTGNRIEAPLVRREGTSTAVAWKDALSELLDRAHSLGSSPVKAVASPHASNEDLAALATLVDALGGGDLVYRGRRTELEIELKGFPSLARRRDLTPNAKGAELLGAKRVGSDDATGGLDDVASHDGVVIVLGDGLLDQAEGFGENAGLFIYVGQHGSPAAEHADFVLPVTTFAEQEGTFTNRDGRVQRFWPGLKAPGMARPAWLILGALAAALGRAPGPVRTAAEAFSTFAASVPAFEGLTYDDIGTRGAVVNETVSLTGDRV
ncbi:MAG: molybdopterin-dependent oxidoreductase, partial [Gemmatimonadota bacterium]